MFVDEHVYKYVFVLNWTYMIIQWDDHSVRPHCNIVHSVEPALSALWTVSCMLFRAGINTMYKRITILTKGIQDIDTKQINILMQNVSLTKTFCAEVLNCFLFHVTSSFDECSFTLYFLIGSQSLFLNTTTCLKASTLWHGWRFSKQVLLEDLQTECVNVKYWFRPYC